MSFIVVVLFTLSVVAVVDCGTPSAAIGVLIQPYNSTTVGSQIIFRCMDGLIPEKEVSAVCRSDGEWSQDPEIHVCGANNSGYCLSTNS